MAKTDNEWGEFKSATEDSTRSLIWSGVGDGGGGKSHFALTAPDPIAYILFDPGGLKSLRENKRFRKKDIRIIDFSKVNAWGRIPRDERVKRAYDMYRNTFDPSWDIAMKKARTVIIDKEDALWELIRYAHDEVDSPDPKSFGELNLEYAALFSQAEAHGVNFGLLRGLKETWGKTGVGQNGKAKMGFTGKFVPRGHKQVEEWVQINLHHRWDEETREFITTIKGKCRLGNARELLDQEYPDLDFPTLGAMLFPNSDSSDWE